MRAGERVDHERSHERRRRDTKVLFHSFLMPILALLLALTFFSSCAENYYYTDSRGREIDTQAAEHFKQGNAYYGKGQYDLAISEYTKAIEIDPKCGDAYHNRSLAWAKKGDYDKANADYAKAKELGYE
jgi:tetratricopeptide (TPR) repeat protein